MGEVIEVVEDVLSQETVALFPQKIGCPWRGGGELAVELACQLAGIWQRVLRPTTRKHFHSPFLLVPDEGEKSTEFLVIVLESLQHPGGAEIQRAELDWNDGVTAPHRSDNLLMTLGFGSESWQVFQSLVQRLLVVLLQGDATDQGADIAIREHKGGIRPLDALCWHQGGRPCKKAVEVQAGV